METKVCPHCAETIKAAAKVCPHCRFWQRRWSPYNPIVWASAYLILVIGLLGFFGVWAEELFGPKEDYAEFRDKIAVVNSQASLRIANSNQVVSVAGILTNKSGTAWKEVGVEVQFLDKSGKVFDVIPAKANDFSGIGMLAHAEGAFKVEGRVARPSDNYTNYSVVVRWAEDARKPW